MYTSPVNTIYYYSSFHLLSTKKQEKEEPTNKSSDGLAGATARPNRLMEELPNQKKKRRNQG